MFKRLLMIGVIGVSLLVMSKNDVAAQYNYFGGGWKFGTYDHIMTYTGVKGSDFNNCPQGEDCVFFVSGSAWYDNAKSCCVGKNCVNEPLSPGIGHTVRLSETVSPALDALCKKKGKCEGTATYPNSVADLNNNADLFQFCKDVVCNNPTLVAEGNFGDAAGCNANITTQQCFNGLFFNELANQNCRNKNDLVIRVLTKGVCTTAQPFVCTDPNNPATCTAANINPVGVRYTFPSFDQKTGDSFASQRDDTCIACVGNTGPCEPQL